MSNELKVYRIKDMVEVTGLTRNCINGMIKRGELAVIKAGRNILIPRQSIENFLNSAK